VKVFVTGATGVLGRRAVRRLIDAGHDVTGVARSAEKAAQLRRAGAEAAEIDLFDPAAVKAAVAGHETACNLATSVPPVARVAMPGAWAENDRIRTEVSANVVDALLANGGQRLVQEALAFVYRDGGDRLLDEDSPVEPPPFARAVLTAEAQVRRFTAAGGHGVTLRFGNFYAPDSEQSTVAVRAARRGLYASGFGGDAYWPSIHADDAASAVVAALEVPAGTYNVVDDEPMRHRDDAAALAAAVGRRRLRVPPRGLARLGGSKGSFFARSLRVSNHRFREATPWTPRYPSTREGWPAVVAAMGSGTDG